MAFKVYPYKVGSRSARQLADHLNGRVLLHNGSRYRPRVGDTVINWGSSEVPNYAPATVLNQDTSRASNKLTSFQTLAQSNVSIPNFWTDRAQIPADAFPIVCRTMLRGHSGAGIVVADNVGGLVQSPLYVKYIKKAEEYRVHVLHDDIILAQRKARRSDREDVDYRIRNLDGGFVFVLINEDELPADAREQSIIATRSLGLDFGAVDIIWNRHYNRSYVLEVNCAPGLEERTAQAYAQIFRAL